MLTHIHYTCANHIVERETEKGREDECQSVSSNIFLSLWYDLTWDWTLVSQTIAEYSKGAFVLPLTRVGKLTYLFLE